MSDRHDVADLVLRFAWCLDAKDWDGVRSCFADPVDCDYGDLRGAAQRLGADAYVALRREALAHLRTHHLCSPPLVDLRGDEAEARTAMLIQRLDPARPEPNTFDTLAHYVHRFRRTPDGWRITAVQQRVAWNRGNPEIHAGAKR